MKNLAKLLCSLSFILFLVRCTPRQNNPTTWINPQNTKTRGIETCPLAAKIVTKSESIPATRFLPMALDPTYESYIVKFKEAHSISSSGNTVHEYAIGMMQLKSISGSLYNMRISGSTVDKSKVLTQLAQQPDIEYIEPDYPIEAIPQTSALDVPDDPYFAKQWFHQTLNSLSAWSITEGSSDVLVAIVDTGIDYTHPDLVNNIWTNPNEIVNGQDDDDNGWIDDIHGWNFVANNNDPRTTTRSPHGSHVAGLIGASGNNHIGVVGVAPKVKMIALKFMDDSGAGVTSNAVKAIDYAIQKKVFLINNSWGSNRYSRSLSDAITRAANAGILFMAAAGNGDKGIGYDLKNKAWYPASYPQWNVFSVAATDSRDQLAPFSNYAKTKVDVAAPGYSIYSTVSDENYQMMSGTSMATPIVSGMAVLLKATNPHLNSGQILDILRQSTDKLPHLKDKIISGGRVNAYEAVLLAQASRNCEDRE
ncbi:MAG: S8 family serine peptidase [Bdellovibrionaceae bacterium]|nr:S8 family serine peptidase [Pseudobdellovibrionaceae bacterium]